MNKIGQANLSKKAHKLKTNMLVSCCYSSKIAAKINNILKKKKTKEVCSSRTCSKKENPDPPRFIKTPRKCR
jgi:hypothetical protein